MLASETTDQELIERLQRGWIVGGAAAPTMSQLPAAWHPLLQTVTAERYKLLALALSSQYQTLLLAPRSGTALQALPDLPMLPLPPLSAALRPLFRRLLSKLSSQSAVALLPLLGLLLQRGMTAHPEDWLPSARDEQLPAIYQPWAHWVAQLQSTCEAQALDELLDVDNWQSFYPAERLMQLRRMRLVDPDAARQLIQSCVDAEPADQRLRIIELLANNLSAADADYLASLTANRSKKIATLAAQLLARLGIGALDEQPAELLALAQELAEGFEVKPGGLLSAKKHIVARSLKSKKQQAIRTELLQKVAFQDFAKALHIEQAELATGWQFSAHRAGDNQAFVSKALETLPEHLLAPLVENALAQLDDSDAMPRLMQLFVPRLAPIARSQLMYRLLTRKGIRFNFRDCLSYSDQPLLELDWHTLHKTPAWQSVVRSVKAFQAIEQAYVEQNILEAELYALGLLLPQSLAQQVLDKLIESGIMSADPVLDALKLNSQLTHQNPEDKP